MRSNRSSGRIRKPNTVSCVVLKASRFLITPQMTEISTMPSRPAAWRVLSNCPPPLTPHPFRFAVKHFQSAEVWLFGQFLHNLKARQLFINPSNRFTLVRVQESDPLVQKMCKSFGNWG